MIKRFNSLPYSSHFSPSAEDSCSTVASMESLGAGFAAFSGFEGADDDAGVAGLSAFDLIMPFGVDMPLVG